MFGHIQTNLADLAEEQKSRYKAAYCGLCRTIGKRHGQLARLGLSYDLTFLSLLLSSLYEPEECHTHCRCAIHPCKKHCSVTNAVTEYAADMTVALTYYKCLDDWKDDRNLIRFLYAKCLEKRYEQVKKSWPRQCLAIEKELDVLSRIEQSKSSNPDAAANSFGRLMEELFVLKEDEWEHPLRILGYNLGKYIYFADAVLDFEKDQKKSSYNPLNYIESKPEELRPVLESFLGSASQAFEYLPLVQDVPLLKNILYSGIWLKYNQGMNKRSKKEND